MSWFSWILPEDFVDQNGSLLVASAAVLVPLLGFVLYRKFCQWNTYECVDDNELLKARLEAARLKQQQKYDQFLKESGDEMKQLNANLEKELKESPNGDRSRPKPKGPGSDGLLSDRDYFPLMGGGMGTTYKPENKRGKCGGGGCG